MVPQLDGNIMSQMIATQIRIVTWTWQVPI